MDRVADIVGIAQLQELMMRNSARWAASVHERNLTVLKPRY